MGSAPDHSWRVPQPWLAPCPFTIAAVHRKYSRNFRLNLHPDFLAPTQASGANVALPPDTASLVHVSTGPALRILSRRSRHEVGVSVVQLQWMASFIAVVDTGGFTLAGNHLCYAQSSISHHIRMLERDLGVCLLDRSTTQARLTHEGMQFLPSARRVLHEIDASRQRIRGRSGSFETP